MRMVLTSEAAGHTVVGLSARLPAGPPATLADLEVADGRRPRPPPRRTASEARLLNFVDVTQQPLEDSYDAHHPPPFRVDIID